MERILVVGAGGQIGTELIPHLQKIYGVENVISADLNDAMVEKMARMGGPAVKLNALDIDAFRNVVKEYQVDSIFNMVALLSATGEAKPELAWDINIGALMNSLSIAKEFNCALFTPSSIGAFGDNTPKDATPQDTVMRPNTIYGEILNNL